MVDKTVAEAVDVVAEIAAAVEETQGITQGIILVVGEKDNVTY
jgi:hypothetical protein